MVTIKCKGSFKNTDSFFKRAKDYRKNMQILETCAKKGIDALSMATPIDTGKTAASWEYEIHYLGGDIRIDFKNTNLNNGVNIAILLQYGHGTGNGGYVQGRDYINPALRPVFDDMADAVWKELTK